MSVYEKTVDRVYECTECHTRYLDREEATKCHELPVAVFEARHDHRTTPILVWADIDEGIAQMVRDLNNLPGVRTHTSCEGGMTYAPYVMASWPEYLDAEIRSRYDVGESGNGWAYLHPKATPNG